MSTNDVVIFDSADKAPPAPAGRHPLAPISGADFANTGRRRLPPQVWMIITIAALAPVGLLLYGAWQAVTDAVIRWPWIVPLAGLLLLAALAAAGIVGLLALWAQARAASLQARVIRTAHGAPVDVGAALAINPMVAEAQQLELYRLQAPYMQHPNLSTLSSSSAQGGREPAALPAPVDVGPVDMSIWMGWLEAAPHVMLAAETGAGKTTTTLHLVAPRLKAGELLYIIDPDSGGWGGLASVGDGENWIAIEQAMEAVLALYGERQQERARYKAAEGRELPHNHHQRLTVVIDEAYKVRLALDKKVGKAASIWQRFIPVLGSGARKVGVSVIALTQTTNVDDLGISRPLQENYTRIALDSASARKLIITEEPDRTRREALFAALAGLAFPAVTERNGQVVLLDRSNLANTPDLRAYSDQLWTPDLKPAARPEDVRLKAIREAKKRGWTREQTRQAGLEFENELWTNA